jgi:branched-chain amino acid transport system substrate-binding protein
VNRRLKIIAASVLVLAASVIVASAATGAKSADPGITKDSILLGAAMPLTGPAAAYGTIGKAADAYFHWYNETRGGVYKRDINFKYLDDSYVPSTALGVMRQLVEQDGIFSSFLNVGTEVNLAIRDYLKQRGVPNLFVSSGATQWGAQHAQYPTMIGWQQDYVSEGIAYGRFIKTKVPQAKIAILAQNDTYGDDLIRGLRTGLGTAQNRIVATQRYEVNDTDLTTYVSKLKSSGANVFMDFGTPAFSIRMLVTAAKLGWSPTTFVNVVAAANIYLQTAVKSGAGSLVNGSYSIGYFKQPDDPAWANDPAIKTYKAIMAKYGSALNQNDSNNTFGYLVADTMVKTLINAGKNPTRASLVKAAMNLNITQPLFYKGIRVTTSNRCRDYFPLSQMRLTKFTDGHSVAFGPIVNGRPNAKNCT